jgi:hypothetical protein
MCTKCRDLILSFWSSRSHRRATWREGRVDGVDGSRFVIQTHQEVTKDNAAHKNPFAYGEVNDHTITQLLRFALGEDVVGPLFGR